MESSSAPPRSRFQFSLRQLGVLVVFLGMAISLALQSRELSLLRVEVRKLRDEAGYLTVENPEQFYAIAVPKHEKDTWSWKVHIPEDGKYLLYVKINDLPAKPGEEIPNLPRTPDTDDAFALGGYAFPLESGEQTLTTALRHLDGDELSLHIASGTSSSTSQFAVANDRWPHFRSFSVRAGVGATTHEQKPDNPLLLLLIRTSDNAGKTPLTTNQVAPGTTFDGIKIWIERVAN